MPKNSIEQIPAQDREEWVVATKFGHKFNEMFTRDDIIDPKGVVKQLDDSLKALQTDYIDLYQFHSLDDEAFQTDGLWDVLAKEVEKGRIHHLGNSYGRRERQVDLESRVPNFGVRRSQNFWTNRGRCREESQG